MHIFTLPPVNVEQGNYEDEIVACAKRKVTIVSHWFLSLQKCTERNSDPFLSLPDYSLIFTLCHSRRHELLPSLTQY